VDGLLYFPLIYPVQNLSYIKTKLAKASPSLMDAVIICALSRHSTLEDAKEVEEFFSVNPVPSSARKISQTVEGIRTNGAMLDRVKGSKLVDPALWE